MSNNHHILEQQAQTLGPFQNVQHQYINQNSQPHVIITREDIYKKVKKIDIEAVKQFLFYDYLSIGRVKLFYDFDDDDAYNLLTDHLLTNSSPFQKLDYLVSLKTYSSIPNSFLNWFASDLRAGLYFSAYVDTEFVQDCFYGGIEFLYWIKSIIKISNLEVEKHITIRPNLNTDQSLKEINIGNLNMMKRRYLNRRTPSKKIDWINLEDVEQIQWGYNYLDDRKNLVLSSIFFPKTIKDKYNLILASIDIADDNDFEYKVPNGDKELLFTARGYLIYKMRRAWDSILSTRKKAEDKSKRVVTITQKNYKILIKLSLHQKLSLNKMVNKLIEDEYSLIKEHLDSD
ncbi:MULTISPECIES: hypothetical protein [unclassified Psychrobacter]|uniref:hypothetical protein n=1 Tax=unclassified Psychrobacter TaxID=196806 RepID=UPI00260D480C|nr:hypothetical protein [uncultured Psychrobacter sp.]